MTMSGEKRMPADICFIAEPVRPLKAGAL